MKIQTSEHNPNRRILIIDDNQAIHDDFKKILAGRSGDDHGLAEAEENLFGEPVAKHDFAGFEITSAYQGQEGLAAVEKALAAEAPFAMAFVDIRMPPGWDGVETTTRLWQLDPNLQVVICTAYSDYSWDDMARRLDASDRLVILKKPFDMIEVLQLANALTEKWRLARQARQQLEDLERVVAERTRELSAANEALLRDIAERKRAKAALVESEASLLESQRVGCVGSYVLDIAKETWTSSAILDEIFGIGPGYERTVEGWKAVVHPGDRDAMVAYFREVLARKSRFDRDYRIIRPRDGQQRWVHGLGELKLDEAGRPVRMIGVIQDVTERKNSERRIAAFSTLGQKLNVAKTAKEAGKIIVEIADELLGWDACSFALYSRSEDKLQDALSFDTVDGRHVESNGACDGGSPSPMARRVLAEGGQLILKEDGSQPLPGATPFGNTNKPSASILFVPVRDGSKVIGLLSIHSYKSKAYDQESLKTLQSLADHCSGALTRIQAEEMRHQLEDQLRQVQKMEAVGQLAGGVAHDFNNIMAAVLMHLGLLRSDPALSGQVRQSLIELESDVQRGAALTRQLLMFSRRQVLQMKTLDLNLVVTNLLKMLHRLLGEHIQVVFEGSSVPAMIHGDIGMMEQVVMNFSVNARDAMPKGGRLTISIRIVEIDPGSALTNPEARPGSFVCLSVADTGCGISEAASKHIFEPFYTTKEIGKGTGLGLATVHGIAKQHAGWVEVESKVGEGSTFRVFIPALQRAELPAPEPPAENVRGGTETILLVEDEASVRHIAAKTLKRHGYRVLEAVNGQEALRHWENHRDEIDLLFSDVIMPEGMTGLELAERLKQTKSDLKVIVSSGYTPDLAGRDTDLLRRSQSHFLQKPYPARTLVETVRRCLDED